MTAPPEALTPLVLESAVGYGGGVPRGLHIHPDGRHLIYSLGSCVVIREVGNPRATTFLSNHSGKVSCLTVSRSGKYIASGQATHMGFQADIFVFEFATRKLVHRMMLHKVRVQDLHFSADEQYLASVGGKDDNTLVVWEVASGRPVCGGHCHNELTTCVAFFNTSNTHLITGGVSSLRVWEVDYQQRKINAEDANLGTMRRSITAVAVEATDRYAYCGTTTGDVLCIQLVGPKHFKMSGPQKKATNGILSIALTDTGDVLVGSGSGEVMLLSKINLKILKSVVVLGGVTALTTLGEHFFAGTNKSNVYYLNAITFKEELRQTCHFEAVNDIAFPHNYSELFATCGSNDIRLWNTRTSAELLRIQVGALECNCVVFSRDGHTMVSGWSDGKVRAFGPQSGRLVYAINDAHKLTGMKRVSGSHVGVTAICTDNANRRIISGGADSQVRVWRVSEQTYQLEASMKEHKATINAVAINRNDTECVSASDDGSCIVWDLQRFMRRNIMYAQTYFKALSFFIDESQLLTAGSDKKITYWDAVDCTAIREIEGSKTGEINSVDISPDGRFFASGGADKLVKVWGYDEGVCAQIGVAHSCVITKVRIAPDGKHIVSVSDEGAIMIWRVENLNVTQLV